MNSLKILVVLALMTQSVHIARAQCSLEIPLVDTYPCLHASPLDFSIYADPQGGIFNGPGMQNDGTFIPSNVNLEDSSFPSAISIEVSYTVEVEGQICSDTTSINLGLPTPISIDPLEHTVFCDTDEPITLSTTPSFNESNFNFTVNGLAPQFPFNPSEEGAGTYVIVANHLDFNIGCFSRDTLVLIVHSQESLDNEITVHQEELQEEIELDAEPIILNPYPENGILTGPGIVGNTFDPSIAGLGTHEIQYEFTTPSGGCSSSVTKSITVNGFSGIGNGAINQNPFKLWPNPSSGTITFERLTHASTQGGVLKIFNLSGELVYEQAVLDESEVIETGIKSSGTYFWEYRADEGVPLSGKLIIAK